MSRPALSAAWRAALIPLLLATALLSPRTARAANSTTTIEQLNLREGPGLNYRVLTVMPAGVTVLIAGDPTEGWYPVIYRELKGWAFGAYLNLGSGGGTKTSGAATVVTSWLNLRSGPGTSYKAIARLPYGTVVEILDGPQSGDGYSWFHANANGYGIGYLAGEFLDAGAAGGGAPPASVETVPAPTPPAKTGNAIVDIITAAAVKYGQSPEAMLAVARCESNLNPNDVNPVSGASGLFQFLPSTWRTTPFASYSIFDPWANANAAAWMWQQGRRGEWVC